jgi:transcription elongation GreA/GreB family factor
MTITLVGKDDNAIKPGWISGDSPLGIAILGMSVNDTVLVNDNTVQILDITQGDIE